MVEERKRDCAMDFVLVIEEECTLLRWWEVKICDYYIEHICSVLLICACIQYLSETKKATRIKWQPFDTCSNFSHVCNFIFVILCVTFFRSHDTRYFLLFLKKKP